MAGLLFGLCVGVAAWGLASLTSANPFGARGGWLRDWRSEPGQFGETLTLLGAALLRGPLARAARASLGPVAVFLACPIEPVIGAAALLLVVMATARTTTPGLALMVVALALIGPRAWRSSTLAARRQAWEIEMASLLDQIALQVTGGRNVRQAIEAVGEQGSGQVADAFVRGLRLAWLCGRDTATAIEEQIPEAPDASSAAFLGLLAQTVRRGGALLTIFEDEVRRLRQARRRRLDAAMQTLPLRLTLVNVCTFVAAAAPVAAWVVSSLMENLSALGSMGFAG